MYRSQEQIVNQMSKKMATADVDDDDIDWIWQQLTDWLTDAISHGLAYNAVKIRIMAGVGVSSGKQLARCGLWARLNIRHNPSTVQCPHQCLRKSLQQHKKRLEVSKTY